MRLLPLTDDDFAALLRGDGAIRPGVVAAPGGVELPDVLEHVRRIAATLRSAGYDGGHWLMVVDGEAVGLCGIKAPPSTQGEVEIGYGVAATRRRRGNASAAVAAIVEWACSDPAIRSITARTTPDNVGSQRVLAANGFTPVATADDHDDGKVIVWCKLVK